MAAASPFVDGEPGYAHPRRQRSRAVAAFARKNGKHRLEDGDDKSALRLAMRSPLPGETSRSSLHRHRLARRTHD